ncbi:hypothetical protein DNY73_12720 [Salmonella enterica subsp. diarizonae]|nr:hypothetical protein [Salmonella enterica subsp. diarizonae]
MNAKQSLHELNYTWLSLVQKMLLKDRSIAMFMTGLDNRIAGIIGRMTETQLQRLSSHPHFILTLRIRNPDALECLLQDSRIDHLNPMHAAILCLSENGGGNGV